MDVPTIMSAFRCSKARAEAAHDGLNAAMLLADVTTVRRCAMYAAQVGHETLSLYYDREVWGPTAAQRRYEGRRDLGNTVPGDGERYLGRGRIQLTGRGNYGRFSAWCHARGLVPAPDHFVRNPHLVEQAPWRDIAAAWYWAVARPTLNAVSDRGDVDAATRLINGGTNGLADRRDRYAGALRLGDRLLPTRPATGPAPRGDWFDMASDDDLRRIVDERLSALVPQLVWHHPIPDYYTPQDDAQPAFAVLAWAATHGARALDNATAARAEIAALRTALAQTAVGPAGQPLTADDIRRLLTEALDKVGPLYLARAA